MPKQLKTVTFILLLAMLGISGWPVHGAPQRQESVSIRLKWHHQTQFAGVYVAHQKGFYRDAGLQVRIR